MKQTYITFVHHRCRAYHGGSSGEDDEHLAKVHCDEGWWVAEALWMSCECAGIIERTRRGLYTFLWSPKIMRRVLLAVVKIFLNVILVNPLIRSSSEGFCSLQYVLHTPKYPPN